MNEFWNSNILVPPPVNSFKCKSAIDIKNVISILENAIDTIIVPRTLQLESTIMRRLIYRLKLQYRMDKGFKLFESTNRNLNHLFAFNITKDLMYLLDEVPKKYGKKFYFPSKQMVEYVLVRLQGYSQVCSRVVESAFQTVNLMNGRLKLGHHWEVAIVCIAICSRIWQICKHLTTKCCLLYNELLPLLDKVEITGSKWLPDNYQFPNDLTEWLNYDWLLSKPEVILQLPLELPIFSLLDDDYDNDVEYNGRYTLNMNKTIVITNDSDSEEGEDQMEGVRYKCGINKTDVKLGKKLVNKLISNIMTIDSDSDSATGSNFMRNNIPTFTVDSDDEDEDIHIIESNENHSDIFPHSKNIGGFMPLHENNEVIEINDSVTADEDIGETISRQTFMNNNLKQSGPANTSEVEIYEFSDEDSISSVIEEPTSKKKNKLASPKKVEELLQENSVNTDEADDDIVEPATRKRKKLASPEDKPKNTDESNNNIEESASKKKKSTKISQEEVELVDLPPNIRLKGFVYKMNNSQFLQKFLDKEDQLRDMYPDKISNCKKETKWNTCISSHLEDEDWYTLSYEIKYYIAFINHEIQQTAKYIRIAQDRLKEVLDSNNPIEKYMEPVEMCIDSKMHFINSLTKVPEIQKFLEHESGLRSSEEDKCFFPEVKMNNWHEICSEIKLLILLARQKPMKSILCINKAKGILRKLCSKSNKFDSDDDIDLDEDIEDLRKESKENMDTLSIGTDSNSLCDYVLKSKSYDILPCKRYKRSSPMSKKEKKMFNTQLEAEVNNKTVTDAPIRKLTKKEENKINLALKNRQQYKKRKLKLKNKQKNKKIKSDNHEV